MTVISTNLLSIVLMLFTIVLISKNLVFFKYNTKYLVYTCITVIVLLISEIIEYALYADTPIKGSIGFWMFINFLGFSLSPLVAMFLILFNLKNYKITLKKGILFSIPFIINLICCILSLFTSVVFTFENGIYERGDYFFIPFTICIFYMCVLFYIIIRTKKEMFENEFRYLFSIAIICILFFFFQIYVAKLFVIWSSVAVAVLLYYMFLREKQFKYDIMTSLKNRNEFEKDLTKVEKNQSVGIVIVDINKLKFINDNYGHLVGDYSIITTSNAIQSSFQDEGSCYRIGGDEFAIIIKDCYEALIQKKLTYINEYLTKQNKKSEYKVEVSIGYAIYQYNIDNDIMSAFMRADEMMYINKQAHK